MSLQLHPGNLTQQFQHVSKLLESLQKDMFKVTTQRLVKTLSNRGRRLLLSEQSSVKVQFFFSFSYGTTPVPCGFKGAKCGCNFKQEGKRRGCDSPLPVCSVRKYKNGSIFTCLAFFRNNFLGTRPQATERYATSILDTVLIKNFPFLSKWFNL